MKDLIESTRFEKVVWGLKLGVLSIGLVSTFLLVKVAIPFSINLFVSTVPRVWVFLCRCLAPPYLYIVVNFIIISIAASSTFHQNHPNKKTDRRDDAASQQQHKNQHQPLPPSCPNTSPEIWPAADNSTDTKPPSTAVRFPTEIRSDVEGSPPPQLPPEENASDPPPSARDGGGDGDTMDATWKAIMDGLGAPPARQLRKSDTWDVPPRVDTRAEAVAARRELRKSETFNEGSSAAPEAAAAARQRAGGLRREVPLGHDDLNRRVEAFIHNFRLQRQESHKHYLAMLNRGCY